MPTYTYSCKCGKLTDRTFPKYDDRTETIKCECGCRAEFDFRATASGNTVLSGDLWAKSGGWEGSDNRGSLSRATTADGVADERAFDREHGITKHVDYVRDRDDPDTFRPCFNSAKGRKMWDKSRNFVDPNSYY